MQDTKTRTNHMAVPDTEVLHKGHTSCRIWTHVNVIQFSYPTTSGYSDTEPLKQYVALDYFRLLYIVLPFSFFPAYALLSHCSTQVKYSHSFTLEESRMAADLSERRTNVSIRFALTKLLCFPSTCRANTVVWFILLLGLVELQLSICRRQFSNTIHRFFH